MSQTNAPSRSIRERYSSFCDRLHGFAQNNRMLVNNKQSASTLPFRLLFQLLFPVLTFGFLFRPADLQPDALPGLLLGLGATAFTAVLAHLLFRSEFLIKPFMSRKGWPYFLPQLLVMLAYCALIFVIPGMVLK